MKIFVLLFTLIMAGPTLAKNLKLNLNNSKIITQDLQHENLNFDFLSSDGSIWNDCKHEKGKEPHAWIVYCGKLTFKLHMFLREYQREEETTFEFHYWADELDNLKETHTQSTWLTVDKKTKPKHVIAYLGFTSDAMQLRMEINP